MNGLSRRGVLQGAAMGSALAAGNAFASPLDGERMLPPDVNGASFAAAVKELRAIVGDA
jgi:4-cresol dehydrogenase (hydroxylating)